MLVASSPEVVCVLATVKPQGKFSNFPKQRFSNRFQILPNFDMIQYVKVNGR